MNAHKNFFFQLRELIFASALFFGGVIFSYGQQFNFKEVDLDGNKNALSSIEISPDGKTLAIATANGPVILWDIERQKIARKIEVSDFPWGPYMTYSADGKYLLLVQQFYTDWMLNRDRPSSAAVMDVASGKIVLTRNGAHSAALTPDSKSLITLEGGTITFWNISSGAEERKFNPPDVTNSFAISPDGNTIAVSQKSSEANLKDIPTVRDDKKAIKEALKYREVAVFYDAKTLERKFIANDLFDIVFSMHFSGDGSSLYLFNAPNTKRTGQGGASRHGYIQVVNSEKGDVSRVIFSTNASEPIYKESTDGKYFASTSVEQKFYVLNTVALFDKESGSMLKNFQNDFRLNENTHINRACFEFLPDHKTMALGYGYKLVLWSFTE